MVRHTDLSSAVEMASVEGARGGRRQASVVGSSTKAVVDVADRERGDTRRVTVDGRRVWEGRSTGGGWSERRCGRQDLVEEKVQAMGVSGRSSEWRDGREACGGRGRGGCHARSMGRSMRRGGGGAEAG
ncbi:uncharacterized protein A4U43_UnF9860 [Asparagus officinalis]|uniref:Uncharacterized protein n=1 Tax=Asparagus officinalis TaxID=4686 RepID=A0A1R3L5M5_ASPOF|nr:uncharacterized protein A4U43_UnF9860 [Asparagus officinalis]